jgi:hypothetical protein
MHAYCITGGTNKTRVAFIQKKCEELHIATFDQRVVKPDEKQTIKIDAIREWIHSLQLSSPRGSVGGIIWDASAMTHEAQQALLKTIEEPPPHTTLFLETENEQNLLPTILSRVTKMSHQEDKNVSTEKVTEALRLLLTCSSLPKHASVRQLESSLPKKEDAKEWVNLLLAGLSNEKTSLTHAQRASYISSCLNAKKALHLHVSHTFVVERICFANPLDKHQIIA